VVGQLLQREEAAMHSQTQKIKEVVTDNKALTSHRRDGDDDGGTVTNQVVLHQKAKVNPFTTSTRECSAIHRSTEGVPTLVDLLVQDQSQTAKTLIKTTGEPPGRFQIKLAEPLEQRMIDTNALLPH